MCFAAEVTGRSLAVKSEICCMLLWHAHADESSAGAYKVAVHMSRRSQCKTPARARVCAMAANRDAKRARLQSLMASLPYVSQSALGAILKVAQEEDGLPAIGSRQAVQAIQKESANINTPYGTVLQVIRVQGHDVAFQHPAAFLHVACGVSPALSALVSKASRAVGPRPLSLVLYCDEVTPGNQLAYKNKRRTWTIYWTVTEFEATAQSDEDNSHHINTNQHEFKCIVCTPCAGGVVCSDSG